MTNCLNAIRPRSERPSLMSPKKDGAPHDGATQDSCGRFTLAKPKFGIALDWYLRWKVCCSRSSEHPNNTQEFAQANSQKAKANLLRSAD